MSQIGLQFLISFMCLLLLVVSITPSSESLMETGPANVKKIRLNMTRELVYRNPQMSYIIQSPNFTSTSPTSYNRGPLIFQWNKSIDNPKNQTSITGIAKLTYANWADIRTEIMINRCGHSDSWTLLDLAQDIFHRFYAKISRTDGNNSHSNSDSRRALCPFEKYDILSPDQDTWTRDPVHGIICNTEVAVNLKVSLENEEGGSSLILDALYAGTIQCLDKNLEPIRSDKSFKLKYNSESGSFEATPMDLFLPSN